MPETALLTDITLLHQAMYDLMASITGIADLQFLGFDSRRTNNPLSEICLHISLAEMEVDYKRPIPMEGNRLIQPQGDLQNANYNGENLQYYESSLAVYPLPITLNYRIESWCYSAETQLALDLALMRTFPSRGHLNFEIEDVEYIFPINLISVTTLDDLKENYRNRVYLYRVETWVGSHMPSVEHTNITSTIVETYQSNTTEALGDAEASEFTDELVDEPDA